MRQICIVMIAVVCLALTGCGRLTPLPDRNLKRKVADTDVVGTWKLTSQSLGQLTRDGYIVDPSHALSITFHADGTLEFASVMDGISGWGTYVEGLGNWALEHDTSGDSNIEKMNALRLDIGGAEVIDRRYLNFAEEDGQLLLWNYYGDPDSWEFMEYERRD